jgi:hypothetical protein
MEQFENIFLCSNRCYNKQRIPNFSVHEDSRTERAYLRDSTLILFPFISRSLS